MTSDHTAGLDDETSTTNEHSPVDASRIELIAIHGIGEIKPGDDLAGLIAAATTLQAGDVVVVTQKIVSKAEGRLVAIDPDDPLAHKAIVEAESVRVVRRRGDLIISDPQARP